MSDRQSNIAKNAEIVAKLEQLRAELIVLGYAACLDVSGGAHHALSVSLIVSPTAEDNLAARATLAWGDELSHANKAELTSRIDDRRGSLEDIFKCDLLRDAKPRLTNTKIYERARKSLVLNRARVEQQAQIFQAALDGSSEAELAAKFNLSLHVVRTLLAESRTMAALGKKNDAFSFLSQRTLNCLVSEDLRTVADVREAWDGGKLKRIPNLGVVGCAEINLWLLESEVAC